MLVEGRRRTERIENVEGKKGKRAQKRRKKVDKDGEMRGRDSVTGREQSERSDSFRFSMETVSVKRSNEKEKDVQSILKVNIT